MKRLSILGAAVLAALFASEALAWDFLYMTPLGGRWVRSDNPLQVEEYDHRSEARLSALVEELGENQWRLYTVWNRTEYTCVDGSVAFPDGYDRTVYSPKTNALALAAHKADTNNPHSVTSRQADEAGGTMNGAGAVMAMYGVGADKTNGVTLLDGNGNAIDFKYDRWGHAGDRDFWFISTNATWDFRTLGRPMWFGAGLATTGEVAEAASTAAEALSAAADHAGNTSNPHNVTAAQIGALTAETDPVWTAQSNAVLSGIAALRTDVDALSGGASNSVSAIASNLAAHVAATDNPHGVTAEQLGALTEETDPSWTAEKASVWEAVGSLSNEVAGAAAASQVWEAVGSLSNAVAGVQGATTSSVANVESAVEAHAGRTDNPHGVTAAQIGALTEETDPLWAAKSNAVETAISALETSVDTNTGDIEDLQSGLASHRINHTNPHQVTAAQVGALPVTGGTIADGAYTYYGQALNYLHADEGTMELHGDSTLVVEAEDELVLRGENGAIDIDSGLWVMNGLTTPALTVGGTTVTDLVATASIRTHLADTANPHNVTIAQLDVDGAVAEHLGETYGLYMSDTDGVGPIAGFGHYISPEENLWQWDNGEDLVFASSGGTVDFQTEGVPTFHGTNLATMTDLSVSVAELAPYSWVRSQIASATAGNFASLAAFNSHTNDANAHGLGALRATVAALPTEARVATLIDDAIGDLGDVATQGDLANYVPGPVYTAATNDLWGAFSGMATDADIAAATNGLAAASDVSALDGRVTVLESAAYGGDGPDVSGLVSGLVAVSGRVDTAEADIAALQAVAGAAWPTNPAADERVVFPKMHYYQNENDRPVIDPGFYDQGIAPHRSGAISNLALLAASKVEASKMFVHGDPVLASTQFTSNYIAGGSIISMPRTFAATNDTLWCHYNYPDYMGKLHFVWSNAYYTEVVTNYNVVTNGGTVTTNETTATVTNHYQPTVSLTITATNAANEEVSFNVIPRMDGTDQELYIDRTPLYLIRGFYIQTSAYPIPAPSVDPTLIGFWYEKPTTYGEEFDLYGKVLKVDEPDEARGVANKAYVDGIVGGVDLGAIYDRDKATRLHGNEVVFNPRYTLTFEDNNMTFRYGGFPVMTFTGGQKVTPVMTALSNDGDTLYAYMTGTADSEVTLEWCTNLTGDVTFEEVPAERITSQYMSDEYTWCTVINAEGVNSLWMRGWLTTYENQLTDVELVTADGEQSLAELFATVAELHGATNLYAMASDLAAHVARTDNPHQVTAAQIGALTAETDATALAALAAASNHFEAALADLPGLASLEARLAALEAWQGNMGPSIASNEVFSGVMLTALTNMGQKVWNDVAMDENVTNVVFAGNDSYLWEETVSGGKSTFAQNQNLPRTKWKSVAISADGGKAVALPESGNAYIRTRPGVGNYARDTAHYSYWQKAAVSWDGARVLAVNDNTEWVVDSAGNWTGNANPYADAMHPLELTDASATMGGDILLTRDTVTLDGGQRRFSVVMTNGAVVDWRITLPDGIDPSNKVVVTRTPLQAASATEQSTGSAEFPAQPGVTNTHVLKLAGGPYLDVVLDDSAPHPLYVRTASRWSETNRWLLPGYWTNNFTGLEGKVIQYYYGPEDLEYGDTKMLQWNCGYREWRRDYATARFHKDAITGNIVLTNVARVNRLGGHVITNAIYTDGSSYAVSRSGTSSLFVYDEPCNKTQGYLTNYTLVVTNYFVATADGAEGISTQETISSTNRFADSYEPIQAAGSRYWTDAAVSMDSQMRRIWAVEADGHVWRMTGTSWRTGTWASQSGPGTNKWRQVVCSLDGERAIAVGDCMVPCGFTYGSGTNAVEVEANAWYFDGADWYPLYQPVRDTGGTVSFLKWKKAFLSRGGYTAYLLPEGRGYVHKLTYQ